MKVTMNNLHIIRQAAIAVVVATTLGSAVADTLRNGESAYGQPAAAGATARVVDLKATGYANVNYGETVIFRADGVNQFAWTFNGLPNRSLDLAKIAPAGFSAKDYKVYVGRNALYRR